METIHVLVVDDDEDFLKVMVTHLEKRGFQVEAAQDGVEALQILQSRGPFSVVVTDMMMPGMTGLELLRKAKEYDSEIEVIVITAAGTLESAIAAMREEGAFDYLLKPLETIQELSITVNQAAEHRTLRLEKDALQSRLASEGLRLQALISSTADAILSADEHGKLQVVNPAAESLLGKTDLVGLDALTSLPQPLAITVSNWQARAGNQPAVVELPWPVGVSQRISLAPIPGKSKDQFGWVMSIQDITHLKQLDDLKLRLLTEAIGKVRMPLAQSFSTLAELSEISRDASERIAGPVYRLVKLLGRIQVWADDLLSLAKIEAGIGFQAMDVDLRALINRWVPSLHETIGKEKGLDLRMSIEEDIPNVVADQDLVRRMLQDLVTNIVQASDPGGVLQFSVRNQENQIWLEISISQATADQPVGQRAKSERGSSGGSNEAGFDLAMVKAIVTRMGGQLWIRNDDEKPASIAICLPVNIGLETFHQLQELRS